MENTKKRKKQALYFFLVSHRYKTIYIKEYFLKIMKLVNPHKIKILAQTKRTTLRNIKKWGEEGSKLNDVLGLQREQLERQEAALATSGAPLAWQGARPRREDSGLAFVNNGQAAVKAAPQTAGFQPGLPDLLTGK